jgi:hypothetical protein
MTEVDAGGRFTLSNVAPGDYRLDVESKQRLENLARAGGVGRPTAGDVDEFASMPITVTGESLDSLMVQTTSGFQMTGRIAVEGGTLSADALATLRVTVAPVMQGTGISATLQGASGNVSAEGTFLVRGLIGTRLVRVYGLPSGFALKSVHANGMDVTDAGVEIRADVADVEAVVTAKPTTLTGNVTDGTRQPVRDYVVVIFAADGHRWTAPLNRFVTAARPGEAGTFMVTALPAGEYLAAVLDALDAGEWADPENLERLRSKATAFSLTEGETKRLTLIRR